MLAKSHRVSRSTEAELDGVIAGHETRVECADAFLHKVSLVITEPDLGVGMRGADKQAVVLRLRGTRHHFCHSQEACDRPNAPALVGMKRLDLHGDVVAGSPHTD